MTMIICFFNIQMYIIYLHEHDKYTIQLNIN